MIYDTVIFDLDGTVLDTLDDLADSVNYALSANKLSSRTKEEVRSFVGNGIKKLIERSVPTGTDSHITQKVLEDFIAHYKDNCTNKTAPYDGICDLLKQLKSLGVKTAVVSNKADFAVGQLCKQYFPGLIDISVGEREGVKAKPCPDSVLEVMKKLNSFPETTVYVGDSEVDIQTAQNASIPCISVDWGFKTKEFLERNKAQLIVSDMENLLCELIK